MLERYPKHSPLFFRINDTLNKKLLQSLLDQGYLVFPDRRSHLYLPGTDFIKRRHVKADLALLKATDHTIVPHEELTEKDMDRLQELYQQLFIKKYSRFNPDYTRKFFQEAVRYRWHDYVALRNPEGEVDAFISWFYRDNVMLCGPLGFDCKQNRKKGLYRMLMALALKHAHENELILNFGAGADSFKSRRGSTSSLECTAVYCQHLPIYRRIPWKTLNWISHKFLKSLFKGDNF